MEFENLLVSKEANGVAVIRLNRPKQYNALNSSLLNELGTALNRFETDDSVRVVVISGSEKAFAAGADIAEMAGKTAAEMENLISGASGWKAISEFSKPTIGAVSGLALGGGFELALQCDMLIASEGARFGLPEVTLGVIPGAGGTQRIARLVGKSLAMEMVLNARPMMADEALQRGVVSRVVPGDQLMEEAIGLAEEIAERAQPAIRAGKACVNKAILTTLEQGLPFERESFFPLFESDEAVELMQAFLTKGK